MMVTSVPTIMPPPTCDKKYRRDHVLQRVMRKSKNHESINSQAITGPYLSKPAGDWSRMRKMQT